MHTPVHPRPAIELVRHSPIALVLLDLSTHRVVEISDLGLQVLGGTRDEVIGELATTFSDHKQQTAEALALLTSRKVEGYQSSRRLRRVDGTPFDAWVWTRRVPDSDLTLLILSDEPQRRDPHPVSIDPQPSVVGVVDDQWRVVAVSADIDDLLGVDAPSIVGSSATERIHGDDLPELLITVTESLRTGRSASAGVRFLDGAGTWRRVRLLLSPLRDRGDRRMAFVLSSPAPLEASRDGLAEHLRRIALEVRAAGLLTSATGHVARPPETTGLSGRQVEVLDRILAGSRVPAIARDLYLSQSTVRNHLSQIFRKYGVHSQVELIELLRERRSA